MKSLEPSTVIGVLSELWRVNGTPVGTTVAPPTVGRYWMSMYVVGCAGMVAVVVVPEMFVV